MSECVQAYKLSSCALVPAPALEFAHRDDFRPANFPSSFQASLRSTPRDLMFTEQWNIPPLGVFLSFQTKIPFIPEGPLRTKSSATANHDGAPETIAFVAEERRKLRVFSGLSISQGWELPDLLMTDD